jgi:hypothetical protein
MLSAFQLLLAFQVAATLPAGAPADTVPKDTARSRHGPDGTRIVHERIPLTPDLLATAYRDAAARDLVTRARKARLELDSSLLAYDAVSKSRITVGFGLRQTGRERMLLRTESAARVRWREGGGARIDVLGARTAFPMFYPGARVLQDMFDADVIPYYPGREGLLSIAGVRRVTQADEGLYLHPLDRGAEAYYQYRSGDSVTFRLPDGRRIRLREVTVIARSPRWDLIVGSLWFDTRSASLVRAVYRPAAPWDIAKYVESVDPGEFDDVPRLVRPMIFPMTATITAFTVEYGLHEQRWWLPRSQTVEGRARMGVANVSFSMEQSFRYSSVNGTDSLPPIIISEESDSLRRVAERARRDSIRTAARDQRRSGRPPGEDEFRALHCPPGDTLVTTRLMYGRTLPVAVHFPCDTAALAHSPELPPSIFDSGDEMFGLAERNELVKSLTLSLQPAWHPLPPTVHYGFDRGLLRYNRVEGLSAGIGVEQNFGRGVSAEAIARLGTADLQPNAELHLYRGDGRRTVGVGVYRRLDSVGDWGDPFSIGSSLSAFVLGRDDGFYFRSWGAELTGLRESGSTLSWRLFAEQQRGAPVGTHVSIPNALGNHRFQENIPAAHASQLGASLRFRDSYGLDTRGWRLGLDLRAEGATGTFEYARGAVDATISHPLGGRLEGALTASAGSSVGIVPPQRLWYLGGVETVRGQRPGTGAGNAYMLGRAELAYGSLAARPVVFFDVGWVGDRRDWTRPGRPLSGAGVGASFLDGLVRLDVAKGITPRRGVRVDFYLVGRP